MLLETLEHWTAQCEEEESNRIVNPIVILKDGAEAVAINTGDPGAIIVERLDTAEVFTPTHSQENTMRPEIRKFAEAMEAKCAQHDDDRGDGWRHYTLQSLLQRVHEELAEADEAFEECDPERVVEEVVDVANFCMFIFSNLCRMAEKELDG